MFIVAVPVRDVGRSGDRQRPLQVGAWLSDACGAVELLRVDASKLPLFSANALAVLDKIPFDPTARASFELMSGGLMWPDEFPPFGSPGWAAIAPDRVYRFLIAYRASITLGEERDELRPVWDQVVQQAANWPGLRPERRGKSALRRLRAALRRQDKCLAELESQMESSDPGA